MCFHRHLLRQKASDQNGEQLLSGYGAIGVDGISIAIEDIQLDCLCHCAGIPCVFIRVCEVIQHADIACACFHHAREDCRQLCACSGSLRRDFILAYSCDEIIFNSKFHCVLGPILQENRKLMRRCGGISLTAQQYRCAKYARQQSVHSFVLHKILLSFPFPITFFCVCKIKNDCF